jgi:amidohydrolase
MEDLDTRIAEFIDSIRGELTEVNRFIYENPELGSEEFKCSRKLAATLARRGFDVIMPTAGLETAFSATRSTGEDRPHVAFMCEYDAVPGQGHGCGHNLIATSSLGAGLAVSELLGRIRGKVTVLGTPSEEVSGKSGKVAMIRAGLFQGMDLALCCHPFTETFLGQRALSINELRVRFAGRAAHATANPYMGINAGDALQLTLTGLSFLRQQLRPDARIHWGDIQIAGPKNNIPEESSLTLCLRSSESAYGAELVEKAVNCAKGAALMTGCQVDYEKVEGYQSFKLNPTLDRVMTESMLRSGMVMDEPPRFGLNGSSDSGNVSQVVPGTHPMFKIAGGIAIHSREFCQAAGSKSAFEKAITMAKCLAMTAVRVMADPEIRRQVWIDFETKS